MRLVLGVSALGGTAGGAQKSAVELANALAERGHAVTLVGFEWPGAEGVPPFYPVDDRVTVRSLTRVRARPRHGRWAVGDDRRRWRQAHRPMRRALRRILREARADVAMGFLPTTFPHIALAARAHRVPFVVANRNDPAVDYTAERYSPNPYDVKMRWWAAAHAAANLVQVPAYVADFPAAVQRRTVVIPNPVEAPHEEPATRAPTIVSVGRLVPVKGHALVIDAFARAGDALAGWTLDIYGDGPDMESLQAQIDGHGLGESITLRGVDRDVRARLSESSIYAAGAQIEGFSRALGEAMSAGVPAIVIEECRSNAALVRQSGGGVVVEGTVEAFAGALADLAGDSEARERLGAAAEAGAAAFEPSAVYDAWEDVLARVARGERVRVQHDEGGQE